MSLWMKPIQTEERFQMMDCEGSAGRSNCRNSEYPLQCVRLSYLGVLHSLLPFCEGAYTNNYVLAKKVPLYISERFIKRPDFDDAL